MSDKKWSYKTLSILCGINLGKTPSRSKIEYWGKGYSWVSISDLKDKYISKTKEEITETALIESNCKIVKKGTLLMSFKLSIGKLAFTKKDLYTNEAIVALPIKDESELINEYLYYVLKSIPLIGGNQATMGQTLNKQSLSALQIPLPPTLDDQKRIAKVLSQCENLIQKRKESIDLLDDFLKSKFNEMFYNAILPIKTIEEISLNIIDCPHSTPAYQDSISEYPCIRTSEIKNGQIHWKSMKYTNRKDYLKRVERLVPQTGDIIFAREGSVGDAAIIPPNLTLSLGQRVMMFRINPDFAIPEYIWAFIRSEKTQHLIKSRSIGATVRRINISEVRKIKCPIPPIETQNQFAEIVQQIDTLKKHYSHSLKELENLYGSISQRAFKGELDLSKVDISDMEDSKKKDFEEVKENETDNEETLKNKGEIIEIIENKKENDSYLSKNGLLYIEKSKALRSKIYLLLKEANITEIDFSDNLMEINKIGEQIHSEIKEYTPWQIDQNKSVERYIALLPKSILDEYPYVNLFSTNRFDYNIMSLDEYYGIPKDIIMQYGSIEDKTTDLVFFFKKYFSNKLFTIEDVEKKYNQLVYDQGDWFKYEEMKEFIFKAIDGDDALLTQNFEEVEILDIESGKSKIIKKIMLKVI